MVLLACLKLWNILLALPWINIGQINIISNDSLRESSQAFKNNLFHQSPFLISCFTVDYINTHFSCLARFALCPLESSLVSADYPTVMSNQRRVYHEANDSSICTHPLNVLRGTQKMLYAFIQFTKVKYFSHSLWRFMYLSMPTCPIPPHTG